jgi:hypothetical protein
VAGRANGTGDTSPEDCDGLKAGLDFASEEGPISTVVAGPTTPQERDFPISGNPDGPASEEDAFFDFPNFDNDLSNCDEITGSIVLTPPGSKGTLFKSSTFSAIMEKSEGYNEEILKYI